MTSGVLTTGEDAPLNSDAPGSDLDEARAWVLHIQTKLHQWATNDSDQRFDDLHNLLCHPATAIQLDRRHLNELFSLQFLQRKEHASLIGPVGVGKTFLAQASTS